jgi:hypothetical protein
MDGVKVGQDTQDCGGDFGEPQEERTVKQPDTRMHASPRHRHGQHVVKDEFRPVVPDNRVVQILDLISKEEEADAKGLGLVGEQAALGPGRWHGSRFAKGSIYQPPAMRTCVPSQPGNHEAAKGVDSEMTCQNISIDLNVKEWVEILRYNGSQGGKMSVTHTQKHKHILGVRDNRQTTQTHHKQYTVPTLILKKKILINISVPIKNATRTTQVARTDETGGVESLSVLKCSSLSNTSGCLAASFFPMVAMCVGAVGPFGIIGYGSIEVPKMALLIVQSAMLREVCVVYDEVYVLRQ